MDADPRTPLTVLTGFLGSGKTTLLQRVLAVTRERVAVLVNEVADLPIDAHLLADYDEDVLALPGGCVCCTMRDGLYAALDRLLAGRPDRVVLETSGLADPAPLLGALTADARLAGALRLAGVVCAVDCGRAEQLLETEPEVRRQLDLADRVALTKADLAPHRVDATRELLASAAPGRAVREMTRDGEDVDWLFALPFDDVGAAARWLAAGRDLAPAGHGPATTHGVRRDAPIDVDALQLWLRLVAQLDGERVLRVKAVARCARTGRAFALHSAGRSVSPPVLLAAAPRGVPGAEVVLVERGLDERARAQALTALDQALDHR